jgi:hypothetical protein
LSKEFGRNISKMTIGRDGENATNYFAGQIDEFRIVKGKAMYATNFTPPTSAYTYQATYSDEVEAFKEYYQMTTRLQMLRGGYGGNGGYGGGHSGSTGRQTSVGIGGAGRQNLGGFGGGGSGGGAVSASGLVGGNITLAEFGGGVNNRELDLGITSIVKATNGSGGMGRVTGTSVTATTGNGGSCLGGGGGGSGGGASTSSAYVVPKGNDGQYSGGFLSIICKDNFSNIGFVRSNGGNGGNGSNASRISGSTESRLGGGGGGGGAGGGVVSIFHKGTYNNSGTIEVNGGAGGTGGLQTFGTGEAGGAGTSGSAGTISINQL